MRISFVFLAWSFEEVILRAGFGRDWLPRVGFLKVVICGTMLEEVSAEGLPAEPIALFRKAQVYG